MSLSDVGKVCLMSAISGTITLNGKPVSNARLIRTVNKEKDIVDETTTDEKGYFEFPAVYDRTITKFLPMEFVVSQSIVVVHGGRSYELWSGVKRDQEENSESRGRPLIVQCDLNREVALKTVNDNPIFSLCDWDAEADKKKEWILFSTD